MKDHMPSAASSAPPKPFTAIGPQTGLSASARRISAMVLRSWYLMRSSLPRALELVYWPFLQLLTWGFLQKHLSSTDNPAVIAGGVLIGAMLLWDVLVRSQLGLSIAFLEEVWSRNLGHLMMSPLRPNEFVAGLFIVSLIRMAIGLVPVALLSYWFFGFNVFAMGLPLVLFFACLTLTGWALGLATTGAVLRFGLGAEGIVWSAVFVLLPICCVYYPVATLPGWLQPVALALPPTWVFEGMRTLLLEGQVRWSHIGVALLLNLIFMAIGYAIFRYFLHQARVSGTLLQSGE